ncbi:MAG: hypothetical protein M3Z03_14285 [Actinomycetota bacterium]|nr:hypothetical protein [Actinomycetota bacterium]
MSANETSVRDTYDASAPICLREDELIAEQQGFAGRKPNAWDRIGYVQVIDEPRGVAVTNNVASSQTGEIFNVRHAHVFSQVRFCVSGAMRFGADTFERGDLQFVGDSVMYGVMQPSNPPTTEPLKFVQTQFTGPSGRPFIDKTLLQATQDELAKHGEFRDGIFHPTGGHPMDSFDAIVLALETGNFELSGRDKIEYPPQRLSHPLYVHTNELPWREYGDGVEIKHVLNLFETGPNVKLVRLRAGATLPAGKVAFQQTRWVIEGAVEWQDERYDSISVMYYPPDVAYPRTTAAADDTTLLLVQWTNADADDLPSVAL